jgi:hypothetical protein
MAKKQERAELTILVTTQNKVKMLSPEKVIAIYCIIDDILKSAFHKSDKRAKLSDSEILTLCMVAMLQYNGTYLYALNYLYNHGFIRSKICKSRLYRRIETLSLLAEELFAVIGSFFTDVAAQKEFILDSTPIEVCDNIRISRSKLLAGEEFRGYKASFRRYFYGLKLQLLTTRQGIPVNYAITEASLHDSLAMREMKYDISAESVVYADAAYTDQDFEQQIKDNDCIDWLAQKKKNAKDKRDKQTEMKIKRARKRIETTFSQLKDLFKRKIHAVTIEGFLTKIKYFVFALQVKFII